MPLIAVKSKTSKPTLNPRTRERPLATTANTYACARVISLASPLGPTPACLQVADEGLLCDLLWSDPDPETRGWGANLRGVSYTFGHDVIAEFLAKNDLDLICRAHQVWHKSAFPDGKTKKINNNQQLKKKTRR